MGQFSAVQCMDVVLNYNAFSEQCGIVQCSTQHYCSSVQFSADVGSSTVCGSSEQCGAVVQCIIVQCSARCTALVQYGADQYGALH